ncbi:hypothetical protein QTI66_24975 [Variovorax sp. J22R133]|uniref:hypothetical protein n=1 Tax=Variovorax brevis TaxID=3053503 RepID=UPI00257765C8|nr:hypothetical protein [Variovorax sp. J22R133]MDM0115427.1 hypothetical protein [Variovorax sp. J22R133]
MTTTAQPAASASTCPFSQRAADFDPFSDGFQQDAPEYLRWSREERSVFFSPAGRNTCGSSGIRSSIHKRRGMWPAS